MSSVAGSSPVRILWLFQHRTARYEEVQALLREGFEVIPIAGELKDFPSAVTLPEDADPWTPPWRETCSVAPADLAILRDFDYHAPRSLPDAVVDALNRSVDAVLVGTFTPIAYRILRSGFRGIVILRPYGGYPYSAALGRWLAREGRLRWLAECDRYFWCPAIPYQSMVEDSRLTRGEIFWAPTVSAERLGTTWSGRGSEPAICEVISLITTYRRREYARFVELYGALPLRIFGQNPRGGESGTDERIVGTLPDAEYYSGIASCRAMVYAGLGSKYHLHYHAIEALMMRVPLVFFADSALAHTARYFGASEQRLQTMGVVSTPDEASTLASGLLRDAGRAIALAENQQELRELYAPVRWDSIIGNFIRSAVALPRYRRAHATRTDVPPPRGAGALARGVATAARRLLSPAWRRRS